MRKTAVSTVLVALILLSGCSGGSSNDLPPDLTSPSDTDVPTDTPEPTPNDTFVPKFHTHDYWAGQPTVTLFDGAVNIGSDLIDETYFQSDGAVIGRTEFDTKADGDDSGLISGKTDVVYQGTSHIEVKFTWTDPNKIPGLAFSYKHASTPLYTMLGPVVSGQVYRIDLKEGWADMPHQLALTRWKFMVEAFNPAFASYPVKVNYAQGSVQVQMTIFNGGERFIDPPHPYFFTKGPTRYAGEINATLTKCLVVNNTKQTALGSNPVSNPYGIGCPDARGAREFKVAPPHIIPWETTRAIIELYYNYTGDGKAAYAPKLGLTFHASDGPQYQYPKGTEVAPGHMRYEVGVTEAQTDSPYAGQSDWRFGVYPIFQEQRDYGGEITANLHFIVVAVNDGVGDRGMGN